MSRPVLGVIGGMGTQATACFYEKFHALQNVTVEQNYFDVILYSKPSIPDRTAFITGQSEISPLDSLISAARTLESAGVSCIAIPCITSHYFYNELADSVGVPVINLLYETALAARERNVKKVCLLATDGTIKGKVFDSSFEKFGIDVSFVSKSVQADLMELIYNIKCDAGYNPDALERIKMVALSGGGFDGDGAGGADGGADAVVLGCTELCLIPGNCSKAINTLDVLAEAALKKLL